MSSEGDRRRRKRRRQREALQQKEERIAQDGKPCTYCARAMSLKIGALYPTLDHVVPRSQRGKITVWACFTCNAVKRDMSPDAWALYRAEHDFWWVETRRAKNAARWTPRHHQNNLPPSLSETGPEVSDIAGALATV